MSPTSRALGAALVTFLQLGCGASTPPAQPNGNPPPAATADPPPSSAQAAGSPAPAPAPIAAPQEPEVLAEDSSPPGIVKLSREETESAEKTCTPLADAMMAAAKKKVGNAGAAERNAFLLAFLQNPPKIARVDVARCADLLLRNLRAYLAAVIEGEATLVIGFIVVGLARATERDPPELCASAGPVPANLAALAGGSWESKAEDWAAPGWKCARVDLHGRPQRFQYQLVTRAGTWEVIARGFPVKGAAPTELYARGTLEEGHVKPTRQVYRRAVQW